jgi:hypothetical protein
VLAGGVILRNVNLLMLAATAVAIAWKSRNLWVVWRQSRESLEWPLIVGNMDRATLDEAEAGYLGVNASYILEVHFTYNINNTEYVGKYSRTFWFRSEAQDLCRSLREGPLLIRYNPANPEDYFIDPSGRRRTRI